MKGITTDYAEGGTLKKQLLTVFSERTDWPRAYENNVLQFFNTTEGYAEPSGGSWNYVYQYKDHLGNIRLSYQDKNNDGTITASTEIVEENNYYPFGLKQKGYNANINGRHHKYMFGGKEQQDELGLNWYDITARNYDPALGRWMNLDPLAEMSRRYSPYTYAVNNPIYFIDPDGMLQAPNGGSFDKDGSKNDLFVKDKSAFGILNNEYIYNPPTIFENSNPFHYIASNAGPGDPPKTYSGSGTAVGNVVNQLNEVSLGTVKSKGGRNGNSKWFDYTNNSTNLGALVASEVGGSVRFMKEGSLSLKYYPTAWRGGTVARIVTYDLTKWGTRIGKGTSLVTALSGGITFWNSKHSWGDYGKLGISSLSAGLTYFPEPITTGIGIGIGFIDAAGGFNGFYSYLNFEQQLYENTGGIILTLNGFPQYVVLKR